MDEYSETWDRFRTERRLEFGGHTDPDWRGEHVLSASIVVPVNAAGLRDRLSKPRDALGKFPFVSLHPDRFMHITLLLLGFPVEKPKGQDEISYERLQEIEDSTRSSLEGFPAFSAQLANLNAFPGAVFVEAHDGGMLTRLRETIRDGCALAGPSGPPHLTLAYVHAPDGSLAPEEYVATIERYRDWPVGDLTVDRVQITLLDLSDEYSTPEPIAQIPLVR